MICVYFVLYVMIVVFVLALFVGELVLGGVQIYVGANHHCSDGNLNIWLIVNGATFLVLCVFALCDAWSDSYIGDTCCEKPGSIVGTFGFVWLCLGTYWFFTYDVGPNYLKCDDLLYKLGVGLIITEWSIIGMCAACLIVYLCVYLGIVVHALWRH